MFFRVGMRLAIKEGISQSGHSWLGITDFSRDKKMSIAKMVIAFAATSASFAASAQSATAKLDLVGKVALNCTISVTPTAKAASLDLKAGEQNASVGQVTETCNSGTGYTVAIASQNGGQLRSGDASAPLANYSASYDDATGSIASSLTATRSKAFFGRTGNLLINIPANAQAIAGNYSDSITLVIAAK